MHEKDKPLCIDYSAHLDSCERVSDVLHTLVRMYSHWIAVSRDVSLSFAPQESIAHLVVNGISMDIVKLVIEAMDLKPVVRCISEPIEWEKAPT